MLWYFKNTYLTTKDTQLVKFEFMTEKEKNTNKNNNNNNQEEGK